LVLRTPHGIFGRSHEPENDVSHLDFLRYATVALLCATSLAKADERVRAADAEMFPADVRYSGVSIGYALGAILGGAFAPLIAEVLLKNTGQSWTIGVYVLVITIISLVAVSVVRETRGVPLDTQSVEVVAARTAAGVR